MQFVMIVSFFLINTVKGVLTRYWKPQKSKPLFQTGKLNMNQNGMDLSIQGMNTGTINAGGHGHDTEEKCGIWRNGNSVTLCSDC